MPQKKIKRSSRKRPNHKMLFLILGFIAIALVGFFAFNSYSSSKSKTGIASSEELMAIDQVSAAVSGISLSTTGNENCANQIGGNDLVFASSYTVSCFSETNPIARTAPGANCQSASSILADARSFCESRRSTPTPQVNGGIKPPSPCNIAGAGDINFDGYVTNADVDLVKLFATGSKNPTTAQKLRADINGTNTITSSDIAGVSAYARSEISTFPVCGTTIPTPTNTLCPNSLPNGSINTCINGSSCPSGYTVYGSTISNACGTGKTCCNKIIATPTPNNPVPTQTSTCPGSCLAPGFNGKSCATGKKWAQQGSKYNCSGRTPTCYVCQ